MPESRVSLGDGFINARSRCQHYFASLYGFCGLAHLTGIAASTIKPVKHFYFEEEINERLKTTKSKRS
jgi:hypothetical protein